MTGAPELFLSEEEASRLAGVVNDMVQEYGLSMSRKSMLVLNTLVVCGTIYLPRAIAMGQRIKREKMEQSHTLNSVERRPPVVAPGESVDKDTIEQAIRDMGG